MSTGKWYKIDQTIIDTYDNSQDVCVRLTPREIMILTGQCEYIGWSTRWTNLSYDKATLNDIKESIVTKLATWEDCAGMGISELRINNCVLEYLVDGGWVPVLGWDASCFQGEQGIQGEQGEPGADGADGASVEMRVDNGFIQWRQDDNEPTWTNLIAIEDLKGEQGEPGADGADGAGFENSELREILIREHIATFVVPNDRSAVVWDKAVNDWSEYENLYFRGQWKPPTGAVNGYPVRISLNEDVTFGHYMLAQNGNNAGFGDTVLFTYPQYDGYFEGRIFGINDASNATIECWQSYTLNNQFNQLHYNTRSNVIWTQTDEVDKISFYSPALSIGEGSVFELYGERKISVWCDIPEDPSQEPIPHDWSAELFFANQDFDSGITINSGLRANGGTDELLTDPGDFDLLDVTFDFGESTQIVSLSWRMSGYLGNPSGIDTYVENPQEACLVDVLPTNDYQEYNLLDRTGSTLRWSVTFDNGNGTMSVMLTRLIIRGTGTIPASLSAYEII